MTDWILIERKKRIYCAFQFLLLGGRKMMLVPKWKCETVRQLWGEDNEIQFGAF